MLALTAARDISIILVALESLVIGVLLSVLIVQVTKLTRLMRDEVLPILNSTQETVSTVRGTATFVSEQVVQPAVKVASVSAGVRRGLAVLFGKGSQVAGGNQTIQNQPTQ
jgi:hypothetical protein